MELTRAGQHCVLHSKRRYGSYSKTSMTQDAHSGRGKKTITHHLSSSRRNMSLTNNHHSIIQAQATTQWLSLPHHFRLETSLKQCTQSPFERDFIASVRLHHLHVLFLHSLLLLKSP